MENMAPLRSSESHGGSRDLFVRTRSDDSSHLAEHQQVQLDGRRQKACRSIGAKLAYARSSAFGQVLNSVLSQMLSLNVIQHSKIGRAHV